MATNRGWFHVHQGHKTKENRLKKKGSNTIETKLRVSNTVSKFMIDPTSKRVTVTPSKTHDRA